MRLTKIALVAAACALTANHAHAQVLPVTILGSDEVITADTTIFNPSRQGAGTVAITPGATLVIVSQYATTIDSAFVENGDADTANLRPIDGTIYKVDGVTGLATGGNVIKRGGGVLQINSWTAIAGTQRRGTEWWSDTDGALGFDLPFTSDSHFAGTSSVPDLQPSVTGNVDGRNGSRLNGLQGTFTIDQGTVRLAGFLNVWHDHGIDDVTNFNDRLKLPVVQRYTVENRDGLDSDGLPNGTAGLLAARMTGVSGIILNGSSVLELTNSPLNIPTETSTTVNQGAALRVQYLRNLQAGLDTDTGDEHDQLQTELVVGTTTEYRVVLHVDQGRTGSIGILSGAGGVLKSGPGDFIVINESRLTGDITVGGGKLILDSAQGLAIASAASVNLAGNPSGAPVNGPRQGGNVRYIEQRLDVNGGGPETLFKPSYAPAPGTRVLSSVSVTDPDNGLVTTTWSETISGSSLEILGDQTIRNFQANFAMSAAPERVDGAVAGTAASAIQRAAENTNRGELVIAGTGFGSSVILNGHALTIRQDKGRDGLYEGRILSGFDFNLSLEEDALEEGAYTLSFDRLPDFGTFQLLASPGVGDNRLTLATDIRSAAEIRANIAGALDVSLSDVTVTDVTSATGAALSWRVEVGAAGTLASSPGSLRSGRVILDATSADAKLALRLEPSTFGEIETRAGSLVINSQGLGNSRINTSGGEFRIIQTDAASLEATVLGAGILRVVAFATIDNGSGTPIEINSLGNIGTLNFAQQQRGFSGELIANDGVDVSLSAVGAGVINTLVNARAITLDGGESGRGSTLRFNDTEQLVRNLSGDALSRVELGRGTMTLEQTDGSRQFLGSMTGTGSVLKQGAANFNFRGVDNLGVGGSDFSGALAVREGSISLATAGSLRTVSALVLASGTTATAQGTNQTVGALFGEAGSTLNIGAATLTVGVTPARLSALRLQLETSFNIQRTLSHNYLGTTELAYQLLGFDDPLAADPANPFRLLTPDDLDRGPLFLASRLDIPPPAPGTPTEEDFLDGTLGMEDQTRLYLERVLYRFDRDRDGVISAAEEAAAVASAANLGFSGTIIASGANQAVTFGGSTQTARVSLSKTGWETLRLLGNANQFGGGAIVVRQGTLEGTVAALASATGGIYVLANSATLDLDGDGVSDAQDIDDDGELDGVDLNNDGVFDETDLLAAGTLALFVESGTSNWSLPVRGDGNLRKTGAGTLVLNAGTGLYTGLTQVQGGTLEIPLVRASLDPLITAATLGAVEVDAGAVIALRTDSATSGPGIDFSYVATDGIVGEGTLAKLGRGTLTIDGALVDVSGGTRVDPLTGDPLSTLSLDVREGTLRLVSDLPSGGDLGRSAVASGATLELNLDADDDFLLEAEFSGAGKILRSGAGTLALDTDPDFAPAPSLGSLGFTGTLELSGGDTSIERPGAFANAKVSVLNAGTSLTLRAGAYRFAGLTGAAGTLFALDPATVLTLDVTTPAGSLLPRVDAFLGRFTGDGDIVKTGDGILSLEPGAANALGEVTVSAGTLRATIDGLGTASTLTVDAGAFLEFSVLSGSQDYTVAVGGAGSVSKFGAGTLRLVGTNGLSAGDLRVLGGTLVVDDRRVGSLIPDAQVSLGATFELLLTGDRELSTQVTGAGNLSFDGDGTARTVTLLNAPLHTGLIGLKGLASLDFDLAVGNVTVGGLDAAVGSSVTLNPGQTLTLNQSSDGAFLGTFLGSGNLVIKGAGVFDYRTNSGNLSDFGGTVVVEGGKLQVGVGNTKLISLTDGSTLLIEVADGVTAAYAGELEVASGVANLVKKGLGTLNLEAGIPQVDNPLLTGRIGTLTVAEGRVLAGVVDGAILDGADIILAAGGTLAVQVDADDPDVSITELITSQGTGGAFEKTGDGVLILSRGTATADLLVTDGILQLGTAGNPAAIGGDVSIATAGRLTGTGTVAGDLSVSGQVAPGYSPGTLAVAGDLNFLAGSTYDAEVLGSAADRINFGGNLAIDPTASLRLTGTSPIGTRHTLLAGGTVPAGNAFGVVGQRLTAKTGDIESPVAYILETIPGAGGRVDAVIVRASAPAGAATSLVSTPLAGVDAAFVASLSELARVNLDPTTGVIADLTVGTLGDRLAGLSEAAAPAAIKSLTGIAYLSGPAMAHLSAAADNEALARRTEQRRYDRGYMSVKSREFFVTATSGSWDSDDSPTSPGYDISRNGLMVGWDKDLSAQSIAGLALSLDRSEAKLAGGGAVDATQYRLHGFAATLLDDEATFLEGGVFVGHSSMDANRGLLALGAGSSPSAMAAGGWIRLGRAALIGHRTSIVPFVQVDVSHVSQDGFQESGSGETEQTKLKVDAIDQTDLRARLGFSLAHAWDSDNGGWRYRLSLDVAYVDALGDTQVDTRATADLDADPATDPAVIRASADPLDQGGLLVTPAFTFGPDHDNTFGLSAELRQLDGGSATSLNFTYRRRF